MYLSNTSFKNKQTETGANLSLSTFLSFIYSYFGHYIKYISPFVFDEIESAQILKINGTRKYVNGNTI